MAGMMNWFLDVPTPKTPEPAPEPKRKYSADEIAKLEAALIKITTTLQARPDLCEHYHEQLALLVEKCNHAKANEEVLR